MLRLTVTTKMQIKFKMKNHSLPLGWLLPKTKNMISAGKFKDSVEALCTVSGAVKCCRLLWTAIGKL